MNGYGRPPTTIWFLRNIQKESKSTVKFETGSSETPNVADLDFSGVSFGLPPVIVLNWKLQFGLAGSKVGHRIGSRVPLPVTLVAWAAYKSVSDGARKPV